MSRDLITALLRILDHALWSIGALAALILLAGDPWYM